MTAMIPQLTMPWPQARQIVDPQAIPRRPDAHPDQRLGVNDFCLVQDRQSRWHCMGILSDEGNRTLFHAVSDTLQGDYRFLERIGSGAADDGPADMWAPFVTWAGQDEAFLFYAHLPRREDGSAPDVTLRRLSSDGNLARWAPHLFAGEKDNIVFREPHVRDPQVFWDDALACYLLYYVIGDGWVDPEAGNVVRVRTSTDLRTWSAPRTVLAPPPGYRAAESIFVQVRDGLYYMWVCGFDYGRMSLYVSDNPFCFGDPVDNRMVETTGHAPEIVTIDGVDWMACVSISSQAGLPPAMHDLPGVWIQPLEWRPMSDDETQRVYRG
ncbi:hypothetical protein [Sphingomonas sp.]|uniref:hypothetical protein n=1 Tax=Sphingomonas sp. TaxID=28214 RepID=UPI0025E3BE3C|nr:hypothetical protein [Sphingomonas sp.]